MRMVDKSPHLRLIVGSSLGCMHTVLWGETYPGLMDGLVGLSDRKSVV